MAKSKGFFSLRTGSTKAHTFSVLNGQQITKDRVWKVANPRSTMQMLQRLSFAAAVMFYKRATQNFFRFAYEDKKQTESDYNAFMRHNAKRAPVMSDKMLDWKYPVVAEWQISAGTLPSIPVDGVGSADGTISIAIEELTPVSQLATWGKASQMIIDKYGLQNGDILTTMLVTTEAVAQGSVSEAIEDRSYIANVQTKEQIGYDIRQIKLDTNSQISLEDTNFFNPAPTSGTTDKLVFVQYTNPASIGGFGLVVSRVDGSKTYVSNSILELSEEGVSALNLGNNEDWRVWAAQNYKKTEGGEYADAILRGSLLP